MARRSAASPAPSNSGPETLTPAAAPTTRRSTRSQSRETHSAPQPTRRRTRGSSRQPAGVLNEVAETPYPAANVIQRNENGLQSVSEDPDEDNDTTRAPLNDTFAQRSPQINRTISVGAGSAFSTYSQDEVARLDTYAILGSLPLLDRVTGKILDEAAPQDATTALLNSNVGLLMDQDSSFSKRILGLVRAFVPMKKTFGNSTFINPEHILRRLLGLDGAETLLSRTWRPDDVLYKANLVVILHLLFQSQDPGAIFHTLSSVDGQFPSVLLSALSPETMSVGGVGESKLVDSTRSFAIALRTQAFIFTISQGIYDGPMIDTLARTFLQEGTGSFPDELDVSDIRKWGNGSILDANDQHDFYTDVRNHVLDLKSLLDSCLDNEERALSLLRQHYSWKSFCETALSYVQQRHIELRELIEKRGGVDVIAESLQKEVERGENEVEGPDINIDAHTNAAPPTVPARAPMVAVNTNTSPQRNVRPRTSNTTRPGGTGPGDEPSTATERQRKNPGQALPILDTQPYREDDRERRGAGLASHANAIARTQRTYDKVQRPRNPWVGSEIDALMDLMATHGTAWAIIKQEDMARDNALQLRSPEDLRFKARNMKVDFLNAGIGLPEGFENVALGLKERNKLREGVREGYEQVSMRTSRAAPQ
ncbi:hypothetical protein CAC42_5078 [Sphaceloma murrayae]|uniref:Myb-like domain-containing protein n=1 Tax=Sphaceloma murrayae TaxID=2082308 RepID=A0A2K1QU53_9PEZI|nr:hypothetical protein CAC42_5078 [Sphaceloma murrayae]